MRAFKKMNKSKKFLALRARNEILLLAIFIVGFLLSSCATARLHPPQILPLDKPAPLSAETILENVINKYKSIDSYYSRGWYSKRGPAYPFVVAYIKPNKFVLIVGSSAIVSNENGIVALSGDKLFKSNTPYTPKEDLRNDELTMFCGAKSCNASDLSMLLSDGLQTLTGSSTCMLRLFMFKNWTAATKLEHLNSFTMDIIGTSRLNNRINYVLELKAEFKKVPVPQQEAYKIWVDKETSLITYIESTFTVKNKIVETTLEQYDTIDLAPQNEQLIFISSDQCGIGEALYDVSCHETNYVWHDSTIAPHQAQETVFSPYRLSFKELFYPTHKKFSDFKPASKGLRDFLSEGKTE